jgi:hypothetical protein
MARRNEAKWLSPEERALLRVTEEERELSGPEIDAELVESRVVQKIGAAPPVKRRASRWPVAVAAAALAAGVAGLFFSSRHTESSPSMFAATESGPVAGDTLALGETVSAGESPLSVEHPGHALWTLAPGSQAALERRDSVVSVRLIAGELEAEVKPRPVPETFVVEAGTLRVAVHGTRFVVKHRPEGVLVDVSEGVVAVTRKGASEATLLRAPAAQSFAFTAAAPSERSGAHRAKQPSPAPHVTARSPVLASAPPEETSLPDEPPISAVEAGVSEVVAAVQRCFGSGSTPDSEVQVFARSTVSFQVTPNGELRGIDFEPPLAPHVTACAREALGKVRFAESQRGIALSRVLELRR